MSDSVRSHRRQSTRLPRSWDSQGKNTGVDCHFLLHCMKVKSEREVTQSCPTLSDPMDCSPPDSSIYGIFQARVLERGATAFSNTFINPYKIFKLFLIPKPMESNKSQLNFRTIATPECQESSGHGRDIETITIIFILIPDKFLFAMQQI